MKPSMILLRNLLVVVLVLCVSNGYAAQPEYLGASKELFAHPHDLELDPAGKWLYVADVNNHEIKVLDPLSLDVVGVVGSGELNSPHDLHFDDQGRLLVADSGNDRIVIYKMEGSKVIFFGQLSDGMRSPEGVTSAPGGVIFVASTGNHKILKFIRNKLVKQIGGRGDGKLEFVRPHDIEMGSDGLLYIGDPGNSRINILSDSLHNKKIFRVRGKSFDEPKYLALDRQNNLFVADQHNNMLRIFDARRREIASITEAGDKGLNYIEGVEAIGDKIWISDTYNNRIVLFRWAR